MVDQIRIDSHDEGISTESMTDSCSIQIKLTPTPHHPLPHPLSPPPPHPSPSVRSHLASKHPPGSVVDHPRESPSPPVASALTPAPSDRCCVGLVHPVLSNLLPRRPNSLHPPSSHYPHHPSTILHLDPFPPAAAEPHTHPQRSQTPRAAQMPAQPGVCASCRSRGHR